MSKENLSNIPIYIRQNLGFPNDISAAPMMDNGGAYHSHDYWELFFLVSGKATHRLNGMDTPLKANDLFLLKPGDNHYILRETPIGEYYLYWNIYIDIEVMQQICALFELEMDVYHFIETSVNPLHLHLEQNELSFFLKLLSSTQSSKSQYKGIVFNVLNLLLLQQNDYLFSDCPSHMRALHEFINKNCFDKNKIKEYLSKIGYSHEHISRQFKKYFHKSIRDYILECKLEYSKNLLRSNDNTITAIASFLEFSCDASFITSFKKYYGITPHKWRIQLKK